MRFFWKRSLSKRKVLVERDDIVDWRCRSLVKMQEVRTKGKPPFSFDEIWADDNLTFSMIWKSPGIQGAMDTVSGNNTLIVIHIS